MRWVPLLLLWVVTFVPACGGKAVAGDPLQGAPDGGPGRGDGGACLGGELLGALGKSGLMVGGAMADATAAGTPVDLRYEYLAGGIPDDASACHASCASGCTAGGAQCSNDAGCSWWGCWQWDQDPPGAYARGFVATAEAAAPTQIPMFTYYEILPSSGASEGAGEVNAVSDASLMQRYFDDWRFLLQQIGTRPVLLHLEPDFWGYAMQVNPDPHAIPAAVASVNATDCANQENSVAGMGRCMIAMVRSYAPNAKVGLHASAWSSGPDVSLNSDPSFDVAAEARKTAAFLSECGESAADVVVVEASDRDAAYYDTLGQNRWWDATNQSLPDFHQAFGWVKALTEALGKPALWWQLPVGNMSLPDTTNAWKDNRLDYFFDHPQELTAVHSVGMAFGAGQGDQTTPETDNGHFVARVRDYVDAGAVPLCP